MPNTPKDLSYLMDVKSDAPAKAGKEDLSYLMDIKSDAPVKAGEEDLSYLMDVKSDAPSPTGKPEPIIPQGSEQVSTVGIPRNAANAGGSRFHAPPQGLQRAIDTLKQAHDAQVAMLVAQGMPREQAEAYQVGSVQGLSPEGWQEVKAQDEARQKSPSLRAFEGVAHGAATPVVNLASAPSGFVREAGKLAQAAGLDEAGKRIQAAGQAIRPMSAQQTLQETAPQTDLGQAADFAGRVAGMVPTLGVLGTGGFAAQSAGTTMNQALDKGAGAGATLAAGALQSGKDLVLLKAASLVPALQTTNPGAAFLVNSAAPNTGMGLALTYSGNLIDKLTWDPQRGAFDGTKDALATGLAFSLLHAPQAMRAAEYRRMASEHPNGVDGFIGDLQAKKDLLSKTEGDMQNTVTVDPQGNQVENYDRTAFDKVNGAITEALRVARTYRDSLLKQGKLTQAMGTGQVNTPTAPPEAPTPLTAGALPAAPLAPSPAPAPPPAAPGMAPATPQATAGIPKDSPEVAALAEQVQQLQILSDQMEARAQQHPFVEEAKNDAEEAADLLQAAKDRLRYIAPEHPLLAPPEPPAAPMGNGPTATPATTIPPAAQPVPQPATPTPAQIRALQPTGHATTPDEIPAQEAPTLPPQTTDTEAGAQDVPEAQSPAGAETPAEALLPEGPGKVPEPAGRELPGSVPPHWDAPTRTWRGLDHLGPEPARFEGETTELGPDPRLQNYQRRNVPVLDIGGVKITAGPRPPYFSFNGGETKTGSPVYSINPRNVGGDAVYLAQGHDTASKFNAHGAGQTLAVYVDTSKLVSFDARQIRTYTPEELKAFGIESQVNLSGAELHRELVAEHGGGKSLSDYLRSLGFNAMVYDLGGESPAWAVFDPRVFKQVTDATKWAPEEIKRRQEFDPEPLKTGKPNETNGHPEILKGAKALAERLAERRNRKLKPGEGLLNLAQPRLVKVEPVPLKGTRTGTLDGNTVNPYEQKPADKPVHPRAQAILDKALEEKDVKTLGQILHPGNKGLRAQFEDKTGVKLPKGWNATRAAIAKHFEEASTQEKAPKESTEVAEKPKKADTLPKKESPDAGATGGVESGGREAGAHGRGTPSATPADAPGRKPAEVPTGSAEGLHAEGDSTEVRGNGPTAGPGDRDVADVRPNGSGDRKPTTGPETLPADQAGDRGKAAKDEQPQAPRNSRNHSIESQADINPFDLSSEAQAKKAARANIEALKLLKRLEAEGRKATPEEQKVLAKYVGWGATTLSKMVDWSRGNKALEATKLKEALEALKTTSGNNAAYPSGIIDQVRDVLGWSEANRMGYSYGRPLVGDLLGKVDQILDGSTQTMGSSGAIDPAWMKEFFPIYRELSDILTPDEMKAAWNSTLNAHYTSVPIVKGMWDMVKHMGFKGGTVLEPSAGIGNFLGLMPKDILPQTALQAVELDKMTGAFLKHLYPDAKVHIRGFQDAKIANNSQDLVITNVPFGDISISDNAHPEWGSPSIHNYFFLKGMEKLKPGGLMVAISSHYTLDSQGSSHRRAMADMGDLVGAVRLPRTAFKANAGTEVVTDIIIMRKKAGDGFRGEAFQVALPTSIGLNRAGEEVTVPVNEYFKAHPEMVLGDYGVGTMRSNEELTVNPRGDLAKELEQATARLPKDIASRFVQQGHDENEIHTDDEDAHAEGHLFVKDGRPMVIDEGKAVLHPWVAEAAQKWPDKPARAQERAKIVVNYVNLRDEALAQVARMMSDGTTDAELAQGQKALTKAYDAFTMRGPKGGFVPVNDPSNAAVFGDESSWARVCALENEVEQENGRPNYIKADIFTKRTVEPFKEPTKADSTPDALEISMNMRGGLDLEYMGKLLGKDVEAVKQELASQNLAFDNPANGIWEPAYLYLGGEVRKKLREAKEAAKDNDAFKRHVEALEKVQPEWTQLGQITAQPGATWLPDSAISNLMRYATGLRLTGLRKDPISGRWALDDASFDKKAIWDELGVPDEIKPWKFAEAVLLNKPLRVTWKDDDGTHVDAVKTQQAQEAKNRAVERWHEGFYKVSDEGRKLIENAFNTEVNNSVPINFPEPAADRFPGMATEWGGRPLKLESYQKIGVSRALKNSILLGHAVGSGKTITLIATAMEQRRLGFAKRPMISVLNSTVRQFVNTAYSLYPNAKILAPGKSERSAKDRAKLYARIATGDWDMVIIPQSFYEMIPVSAARVKAWIDDQVQEINDAIVNAKGDKLKIKDLERLRDSIQSQGDKMMAATDDEKWGNREEETLVDGSTLTVRHKVPKVPTSKQAAKKAAKTTDRLDDLTSRKSDRFATFEDLGIDALLVDEAHGFKNGFFMTSLNNVKGLNPSASSKRAVGMLLKARSIQEKTAGKNITMATGTPITNTMSEAWVMMNYVRPDLLEEGGVSKFDEFISTYGDIASDTEYTAAGKFEPVERLREFVNLQQLGKLWNQAVHVVPQRMILRDKLPTVHYETVMVKPTPAQEEESAWWRGLMDQWKTWSREDKQQVPVGLLYSQISKFLSLDMRTIKRGLGPEQAGGKIPAMVKKAMEFYKQTEADKGAQAIFCDVKNAWRAEGDVWTRLGRSGGEPGFNVFKEVKFQLMRAGVPEHEIVIVDDIPDKDEVRAQVFDKVNNGEVRFIIGSTPRLGTGVNIQTRLIACHNLDIPGRPCDNEQRKGRMERPGNIFGQEDKGGVYWLTYGVEKTLDALMAQRNLNKAKFIEQIMEGLFEGDRAEDIGTEATFSWAEIRGALSGDPRVMKYGEVQAQIQKMEAKRNAWEQGRGDARVKLANAKRDIERFTQESEALSQFAGKVPGIQEEIAKQVEALKKDKEASDPLEDWYAAIEKKVQKKDVSSSIGYENRDFPTKLPNGLTLVRKATADWNILDKPGDAPTLKVQVVLTGTGLPESITPRSGTSSARLPFAMESMSRALESVQEHADVRKRWIAEAKESIPVFEGRQGPYPDQEKLDRLRQESSELEAAINASADAEKKARDEAKAEEGGDSPRTGEQGGIALDIVTAPARMLHALAGTEKGAAALEAIQHLFKGIEATFSPASVSPATRLVVDIKANEQSRMDLDILRLKRAGREAHRVAQILDPNQVIKVMDMIEGKSGGELDPKALRSLLMGALSGRFKGQRLTSMVDATVDEVVRRRELNDALHLAEVKLGAFGGQAQNGYIENYWQRNWKQKGKAAQASGSPKLFEGTKSWMKKRIHPFFSDAVEAGLEPVSWNFIDQFDHGYIDALKYLCDHTIVKIAKEKGLIAYKRGGGPPTKPPEGRAWLDPQIGQVLTRSALVKNEETGKMEWKASPGLHVQGWWHADPYVANILNNMVTKGLASYRGPSTMGVIGAGFRGLRSIQNAMTQSLLSVSGFHGITVSMDAITQSLSDAMQAFANAKPKDGLTSLIKALTVVPVVGENVYQGAKLRKQMLDGTVDPAFEKWYVSGGGRLANDAEHSIGAADKFSSAWHRVLGSQGFVPYVRQEDGTFAKISGAKDFWQRTVAAGTLPALAPFAAIDVAARPLMKHYVPIMKLAAAKILYAQEMKRLPEDASDEMKARSARKVIQHIENRMGQLTKDNLNWHPLLNDFLNGTFLATTWNYGSMALFGGAQVDLARAMRDLGLTAASKFYDKETQDAIRQKIKADRENRGETGDNGWFTRNMSMVLATKLAQILVTGLLTYLFTGSFKRDKNRIDMIRTGEKTSEGKDEYLDLAGYNPAYRDLYEAQMALMGLHHQGNDLTSGWSLKAPSLGPLSQIIHGKISPLVKLGADLWANTDWTGNRQIYDPGASFADRQKQKWDYILKSALPISVKQVVQKWDTEGPRSLRSSFGTNIPPRRATDSDAEAELRQMLLDRQPRVIEHDAADRTAMLSDAKEALALGNQGPLDELTKKGLITPRERENILRSPNGESRHLEALVKNGSISQQEMDTVVRAFNRGDEKPLDALRQDGRVDDSTLGSIKKELIGQPLIARLASNSKIQDIDLFKVWPDMTDAEKVAVFPIMTQKLGTAFRSTPPAGKAALKEKWNQILEEVKSIKAEPRSSE